MSSGETVTHHLRTYPSRPSPPGEGETIPALVAVSGYGRRVGDRRSKRRSVRRARSGLPYRLQGDFMRQEKRICGNRRTLRRQYAARKWASVRVLPGIAGYCRVVGPWEFSTTDERRGFDTELGVDGGDAQRVVDAIGACSSGRNSAKSFAYTGLMGLVGLPLFAQADRLRSAWDRVGRLGPDKFFFSRNLHGREYHQRAVELLLTGKSLTELTRETRTPHSRPSRAGSAVFTGPVGASGGCGGDERNGTGAKVWAVAQGSREAQAAARDPKKSTGHIVRDAAAKYALIRSMAPDYFFRGLLKAA